MDESVVARRMREMRRRGEDRLPVILGEAPSRSGDRYWMFPCSGAVARTLCSMAGIPPMAGESRYGQWTWALYERFDCMNLVDRWPGPQGSGSALPPALAREALVEKLPELMGRVVVMLGARLPRVLCREDECTRFYEWDHVVLADDVISMMVSIPHPSGLNRMYNAPVERERAGAVLRQAMEYARLEAEACD